MPMILCLVALLCYGGWASYELRYYKAEADTLRSKVMSLNKVNRDSLDAIEACKRQYEGILEYEKNKPKPGDNSGDSIDELLERLRLDSTGDNAIPPGSRDGSGPAYAQEAAGDYSLTAGRKGGHKKRRSARDRPRGRGCVLAQGCAGDNRSQ